MAMTFIVAFGLVKAVTNFVAGTLSDRLGRKPILVAGWLIGLPGAAAADLGTGLGLGRVRQRVTRDQPGSHLVNHRDHEDRPGRAQTTWAGDGTQRSRRIYGSLGDGTAHWIHRRTNRVATRTVLPGHRLRGARSRIVDCRGARNPSLRRPRGSQSPRRRRRPRRGPFHARRVYPDQYRGAISIGGKPGRTCEQSQRRHGLGSTTTVLRRGRHLGGAHRCAGSHLRRRCGVSGSSSPAPGPTVLGGNVSLWPGCGFRPWPLG